MAGGAEGCHGQGYRGGGGSGLEEVRPAMKRLCCRVGKRMERRRSGNAMEERSTGIDNLSEVRGVLRTWGPQISDSVPSST